MWSLLHGDFYVIFSKSDCAVWEVRLLLGLWHFDEVGDMKVKTLWWCHWFLRESVWIFIIFVLDFSMVFISDFGVFFNVQMWAKLNWVKFIAQFNFEIKWWPWNTFHTFHTVMAIARVNFSQIQMIITCQSGDLSALIVYELRWGVLPVTVTMQTNANVAREVLAFLSHYNWKQLVYKIICRGCAPRADKPRNRTTLQEQGPSVALKKVSLLQDSLQNKNSKQHTRSVKTWHCLCRSVLLKPLRERHTSENIWATVASTTISEA